MSILRTGDSDTSNGTVARGLSSTAAAITISAVLYVSVTAGWQLLNLAPEPVAAGYRYTQTLSQPLSWIVILIAAIGVGVGWLTGRKWAVGLGIVLPFAVAMALEISEDPTSHNLMPFEMLITWLPAFLIAATGAALGRRLRLRQPR